MRPVPIIVLLIHHCNALGAHSQVLPSFEVRAQHAFQELQQQYFDVAAGGWSSSLWWQNANTIETISNLAIAQPKLKDRVSSALALVFNATSNSTLGRCDIGVYLTFSGYFDDEAWWGIAWLRAYHLTKNTAYLNRSRAVLDDLATRAWSNASCGGGFCWQATKDPVDMKKCYKNAITNELGLTLAAQLALTYRGLHMKKDYEYSLRWARKELEWFVRSGLVNSSYLVNDGLDTFANHEHVCLNNKAEGYTYNQGVILSGLAYMWQLEDPDTGTDNDSVRHLELATHIIKAFFSNQSNYLYPGTHILRESNEAPELYIKNLYAGGPLADALQFKSIFVRHLMYFIQVVSSERRAIEIVRAAGGDLGEWQGFVDENADSIWTRAACAREQPLTAGTSSTIPPLFGYRFGGPCSWAFSGPTATTQTAALDVFIAAAAGRVPYVSIKQFPPFVWESAAPEDVPFERSSIFTEVEFTGRFATYGGADTWYPTWAEDGNLYTPWTDGTVNGVHSSSSCGSDGCMSTTGFAMVIGDDPFNLIVKDVGTFASAPSPYHGRYPCGSLYYNKTWFYGTYTLDNENHEPGSSDVRDHLKNRKAGYCGNWCIQGPFAGFRWSRDQGKTWNEPRVHMASWDDNLFGEQAPDNHTSKVKYGAPHVVDLGRELEHVPAGDDQPMMYIVGHGTSSPHSPSSWMQGSEVYMARVVPTIDAVQDRKHWEFFSGNGEWVKGNASEARPLLSWANRTGVTTMTYIPAVKRYIVCISTPTYGPFTEKQFDTYLLESESITGPFKYITYLREFGPQGYFVNIPSKFIAPKVDPSDGSLTMFLSYSANFHFNHDSSPPGSGYHWTLQEIKLKPTMDLVV